MWLFKSKLERALDREQENFRKFLLYCLYEVAAADGVEDSELEWLYEVIEKHGISPRDLKNLKKDVKKSQITMPADQEAREFIVQMMIRMSLSYQVVTRPEVYKAMHLTEEMGLDPASVPEMLKSIVQEGEGSDDEEERARVAEVASVVDSYIDTREAR